MSSPLLDEAQVIETLTCDIVGSNSKRLQAGAFMVALDAFDRKATRDQFIAALGSATALYDAMGRLSVIENIRSFMQGSGGTVTFVDIEVAGDKAMKLVKQHTDDCMKMIRLLEQCPLDEDKIH